MTMTGRATRQQGGNKHTNRCNSVECECYIDGLQARPEPGAFIPSPDPDDDTVTVRREDVIHAAAWCGITHAESNPCPICARLRAAIDNAPTAEYGCNGYDSNWPESTA